MATLTGRIRFVPGADLVARDLMSSPAITAPSDLNVAQATRVMIEAGLKVLPVVDSEGRLLGVVDREDLLLYFRG
jgi:CBS domain-containing protein